MRCDRVHVIHNRPYYDNGRNENKYLLALRVCSYFHFNLSMTRLLATMTEVCLFIMLVEYRLECMPSSKPPVGTRPGRGRHRSACAACRQTKRKCDGEKPCGWYVPLCMPLFLYLRGLGRPDACSTVPDRQTHVFSRLVIALCGCDRSTSRNRNPSTFRAFVFVAM